MAVVWIWLQTSCMQLLGRLPSVLEAALRPKDLFITCKGRCCEQFDSQLVIVIVVSAAALVLKRSLSLLLSLSLPPSLYLTGRRCQSFRRLLAVEPRRSCSRRRRRASQLRLGGAGPTGGTTAAHQQGAPSQHQIKVRFKRVLVLRGTEKN